LSNEDPKLPPPLPLFTTVFSTVTESNKNCFFHFSELFIQALVLFFSLPSFLRFSFSDPHSLAKTQLLESIHTWLHKIYSHFSRPERLSDPFDFSQERKNIIRPHLQGVRLSL
jgi:hypothetical protein